MRGRRAVWALAALVSLVSLAAAGCNAFPTPTTTHGEGCEPVKVLLAGDSLMQQSWTPIVDRLHSLGYPVETKVMAYGGSSAAEYWAEDPGPWFWATPRDQLRYAVSTWHPDIVVTDWGMNRIWSMWDGQSALFMDWVIDTAMAEVKSIVSDGGAKLFWTTIPQRGDEFWSAAWADNVNNKVLGLGVPLIDWRQALDAQDDHAFQQYLIYPEDGQTRTVRTDDLVHLTPDGVDRVSRWTSAALAPDVCHA